MVSTEAEDEAAGDRGRSRLQHESKSPRADDARVRADSRKPGGRRAEDCAHRRADGQVHVQAEQRAACTGGADGRSCAREDGDGRGRKTCTGGADGRSCAREDGDGRGRKKETRRGCRADGHARMKSRDTTRPRT
jgi:hypothetical protein